MSQKIYSQEQIENKIKWYNRFILPSIATAVVGAGIIISTSRMGPKIEVPEIVNRYNDAKTTLNMLEDKQKALYETPNFLYRTEEINSLDSLLCSKNSDEKNIMINAITSLENDISEMENNPEIVNYENKVEEKTKNKKKRNMCGLITYLFGLTGTVGSSSKGNIWRKRKLDEEKKSASDT